MPASFLRMKDEEGMVKVAFCVLVLCPPFHNLLATGDLDGKFSFQFPFLSKLVFRFKHGTYCTVYGGLRLGCVLPPYYWFGFALSV